MFKIKRRNAFVFSLVLVLCFISYLNYAINKYALLETSNDFTKYEENKLAEVSKELENPNENIIVEEEACTTLNIQSDNKDITIIDSSNTQIDDLVTETSNNIKNSISNSTKRTTYFIESRLNMNVEREKMVLLLNEIIDNDKTDDSNRKSANDEKMKLIDRMNKEKIVESLIKAKGFEEALVFITDNSVNVIVETEKLTDSDVAKILDIVIRETKFPTDNIKISNIF